MQAMAGLRSTNVTKSRHAYGSVAASLLALALMFSACTFGGAQITAAPTTPLPEVVPPLPFADNPDPTLCGIPQPVELRGVAHGEVDGAPLGPVIYLYESHLRRKVVGQLYPGTEVEILLSQSNPTLNYYFVKSMHVEPAQEGWIPAPLVTVHAERT